MQEMFDPADTPDLLAGLTSPDDAAVWKLDEDRALVITTDFFTPVVDDPFDYGRVAAANSLSDVYAMGGTPFLALNIAAMPPDLDPSVSAEIFRGGAVVAKQAGTVIAGGHSIQDKEPKYGMVVVGMVDPHKMFTKGGAKPGDRLYLTKPLGFGTITTALKRQAAREEDVAEAVGWMTRLNRVNKGPMGTIRVSITLCWMPSVTRSRPAKRSSHQSVSSNDLSMPPAAFDRVPDRSHQQMVVNLAFDKVILRPFSHRFKTKLFVVKPCEYDYRHIGVQFMHFKKCLEPVAVREIQIK